MQAEHKREIERIQNVYALRSETRAADSDPLCDLNLFYQGQTARRCIRVLTRAGRLPLAGQRVADIGCGSGQWLVEFLRWGADCSRLAGIDLSETRIDNARRRLPLARLECGDAANLPWPDGSFDMVTQFTMFTSILSDAVRSRAAGEMMRVLKPGGVILWYDFCFDNPRNPDVRGIGEREVRALFPGCTVRTEKATLAPPLARRLVPVSWPAAILLEVVPLLRTHCVALIQPGS